MLKGEKVVFRSVRKFKAPPGSELSKALKDPNYDRKASVYPRFIVNLMKPYQHPSSVVELIARRLYREWAKGGRYIPWRYYDPPTTEFRHSGHSANGNERARWYRIAEMVVETLLCEECVRSLTEAYRKR
jgi:hypothetical protein